MFGVKSCLSESFIVPRSDLFLFRNFNKINQRPFFLYHNGSYLDGCSWRSKPNQSNMIVWAAEGDSTNNSNVFPRMNTRDPYRRLGISREASEEEIQAARKFLVGKHSGHPPSVRLIESAHDQIIMQKLRERRMPKLEIKKKIRAVTESRFFRAVMGHFRTPETHFIVKSSITFALLGALTLFFPTQDGPTIQVALSLVVTLCLIYARLKNNIRAFLYGIGGFIFSWVVGTILMISLVPSSLFKGRWSLEVCTSLISYFVLWISSTYLV